MSQLIPYILEYLKKEYSELSYSISTIDMIFKDFKSHSQNNIDTTELNQSSYDQLQNIMDTSELNHGINLLESYRYIKRKLLALLPE